MWVEDEITHVPNLWRALDVADPVIGERCVSVRNEDQWIARHCDFDYTFICRSGKIIHFTPYT